MKVQIQTRLSDGGGEEYFPLIEKVLNKVMQLENIPWPGEASVLLVEEDEIRAINKRYRALDEVTDVLSFPLLETPAYRIKKPKFHEYDPETGNVLLGDIILCVSRAKQQAAEFGHSISREIAYLAAHSLLHLIGYEHEADEESRLFMRQKEEAALEALGLTRE